MLQYHLEPVIEESECVWGKFLFAGETHALVYNRRWLWLWHVVLRQMEVR